MPSIPAPELSKAGIATTSTGERLIPASVRADGSVRKEVRIRAGYTPPEDVEIYKNRTAHAFRNRGKGGVPGAEFVKSDTSDLAKPAATKNAKRREATRKKAAEASGSKAENGGKASDDPKPAEGVEDPPKVVDPEVEKEKEAKKLTKKIRQARELKVKKEQGGVLLPEQFEKVIKINELIRQLEALGFDANGEKKAKS